MKHQMLAVQVEAEFYATCKRCGREVTIDMTNHGDGAVRIYAEPCVSCAIDVGREEAAAAGGKNG